MPLLAIKKSLSILFHLPMFNHRTRLFNGTEYYFWRKSYTHIHWLAINPYLGLFIVHKIKHGDNLFPSSSCNLEMYDLIQNLVTGFAIATPGSHLCLPAMVNPTMFFDIVMDSEPLGQSFKSSRECSCFKHGGESLVLKDLAFIGLFWDFCAWLVTSHAIMLLVASPSMRGI